MQQVKGAGGRRHTTHKSRKNISRQFIISASYVFVVVEAHVRPLAVPGVLSQLARIRTLGWRETQEKKIKKFGGGGGGAAR